MTDKVIRDGEGFLPKPQHPRGRKTHFIIDWVEKGIVTLRLVTLGTFAVCIYMWVSQIPLPETLSYTWKIILPFWFGTEGM